MSIINQLTNFHQSQGLRDNPLQIAIAKDVKLVLDNTVAFGGKTGEELIKAAQENKVLQFLEDNVLCTIFLWEESPEGFDYWDERDQANHIKIEETI